jgi:hypothetical protein
MQKETVKVDKRFGDEFAGVYEFRQVTQGEYERVLVSYIDALGKVAKQDVLKVNREMLWTGLTKQPDGKPLNRDRVVQGQLPYGLSVKLQEAYDKVNGIAPDEQRFLSSPSDESDLTQGSQSLSSVKNSDGQSSSTTTLAAGPS